MARDRSDEIYSDEEVKRRRDESLRRALSTPPKPHKPNEKKKRVSNPKRRRVSAADSAKR